MSVESQTLAGAGGAQVGGRPGVLAMTLVVRDEEDIIETNLRYHLAQGVDFVYALDHNSGDGTPDILRSFEQMGVLRMLREGGDVHDQATRVTRLARLAHAELGADWVINNDADEFWWPAFGDLKSLLCAIPPPYDVVVARRHDFIPRPDAGEPFHERMIWRLAESRTPTGQRLEPKVTHRGRADIVVAPGNHDVEQPVLRRVPAVPLLEVLHFPARTYAQFERKTLNTGQGYELLPGRDPTTGIDQLQLLGLHRKGELGEYFDGLGRSDAELEEECRAGSVVRDARLRDFLARAGAPGIGDARQLCDVVGGVLALDTARAAAAAQVELAAARAAELDRERGAAQAALASGEAELEAVKQALEVVRNSRLMRSTRAVRRVYYKLK